MKLLRLFLIVLGLILLIAVSDFIYFYRNEPFRFATIFIVSALKDAQKSNLAGASFNIDRAAFFHLRQNKIIYKSDFFNKTSSIDLSKIDKKTKKESLDYLNKILPLALKINSAKFLARVYYDLGLIVYNNNYHEEARDLLSTAVKLEPEAGHLYLELANLYFQEGDLDGGNKIVKSCLDFKSPKKQCQEYLRDNVPVKAFFHIGIFEDIIRTF